MSGLRLCDEVVEVIRELQRVVEGLGSVDRECSVQLHRAARSMALNVWEGAASRAGCRRQRFERAYASAHECLGCLRIGGALGYVGGGQLERLEPRLDSIKARLWVLMRRPR